MELSRKARLPLEEAVALHTLAMAADERGARDRAHELYEESLVLARVLDDGWLLSAATNNLGGMYLIEREYERAVELFEESLAIGEARGDLDRRARELTNLGHATRGLGDVPRARDYYRSGLAAAEELGLVIVSVDALSGFASCEAEAGNAVTATRLLGWVKEQESRLGSPSEARTIELEESLRDRLGPERLALELAAGAALAREDAINLALARSDSKSPR